MAQPLNDAQVRAALLVLNGGRVDLRWRPQPRQPRPAKLERICKDCGQALPLQAFVHVKGRLNSYYPTCRSCGAKRARERYQSDPAERERQKARVRRNRAKRKQAAR